MENSEFPIAECLRCGFRWQKRVVRPVKCPQCQSRNWDKSSVNKEKDKLITFEDMKRVLRGTNKDITNRESRGIE